MRFQDKYNAPSPSLGTMKPADKHNDFVRRIHLLVDVIAQDEDSYNISLSRASFHLQHRLNPHLSSLKPRLRRKSGPRSQYCLQF